MTVTSASWEGERGGETTTETGGVKNGEGEVEGEREILTKEEVGTWEGDPERVPEMAEGRTTGLEEGETTAVI